jgi:hypothetical protein
MFLISEPRPEDFNFKRAPLPDNLSEFQQAADMADQIARAERQHASTFRDITERLNKVCEQIDMVVKAKRR